jgi:hypothetical protein
MQNRSKSIEAATHHEHLPGCNSNHTSASIDIAVAIDNFQGQVDRDMERYSCEEALDCLLSMYKVCTDIMRYRFTADTQTGATKDLCCERHGAGD